MLQSSARCDVAKIHSKQPWFVLNSASDFSLMSSNNRAISHYYSFEASESADVTVAIPDGCVDILFDCNESEPSAMVYGTTLEARHTRFCYSHRYFGVRFAPGVIPGLLQLAADELIEQSHNFLEVAADVSAIFEQIVSQPEFARQVALFDNFIARDCVRESSALTTQIIQEICRQKGNIRIKDLEALTGYTTRTLQTRFRNDTGLSPKLFSRLIRCQSAVYDINQQGQVVFSDLAATLGYSDQSHFLREFKKLVSTTPVDYQNRVRQSTYLGRIRYL
ncbi:helix-turn-helix domain-containing protein [Gynuella sp.]|uniref:helix-turn-helix domain-containing protein n=1 Tax=Gynuella sp. TaxID=2969146 RepID=UPI003D10AF36